MCLLPKRVIFPVLLLCSIFLFVCCYLINSCSSSKYKEEVLQEMGASLRVSRRENKNAFGCTNGNETTRPVCHSVAAAFRRCFRGND